MLLNTSFNESHIKAKADLLFLIEVNFAHLKFDTLCFA